MNSVSDSLMIFTLTPAGLDLARRISNGIPGCNIVHRPPAFAETARAHFNSGQPLLFICATGIVIRSLAPALVDKHQDPAVIVVDENGQFVIPLLSGHEGGAGQLARKIADLLDAHCVVTSATDYSHPVYTLGMGCERGCPRDKLRELYESVLADNPEITEVEELSSIDIKADEQGMIDLAAELAIPYRTHNATILRTVENQLSEKSDIVFRETGCYGVAEAAALVSASNITGIAAELVVKKQKSKQATIAVARSYRQ